MKEEKKYKLVGYLNFFNIVPHLIYPVFQDQNLTLYFGFTDDQAGSVNCGANYTRFTEVPTRCINKVKFLKTTENILEGINENYKIGDLAICGMEFDKDKIYIGSLDKYLEYIKKYLANYENSSVPLSKYWKDKLRDEIEDIEPLIEESQKKLVRKPNKKDQ